MAILSLFLVLLALPFGVSTDAAQEPTTRTPPAARAAAPESDRSPREILEEGNRLFRLGRLGEAVKAYREGWDPHHPDAVLAYNLGTTAHHQGLLPEAVLWYRRAARVSKEDRWLIENLERARQELAAPRLGPPNLLARLGADPTGLWILTALVAWTALLLQMSGLPRRADGGRRHWVDAAALVALLLGVGALAIPHFAAEPAVVLESCADGALPAGSEVWGRKGADGGFVVRGPEGPIPCDDGRVEPVADRRRSRSLATAELVSAGYSEPPPT